MNRLLAAGLVLASLTTAVAYVADSFAFHAPTADRKYFTFYGVLAVSFVAYFGSLRWAVQQRDNRRLTWAILGMAALMRLVLVSSPPILEVDVYRYLWDGVAASHGENPYRYPPNTVLRAAADDERLPLDLKRLAVLRDSSPGLGEILRRIHYGELTTIYPPVSVAVFAIVDLVMPVTASVESRVTTLKGALVLIDLGTVVILMALLRRARRPVGWAVAYAWCPLVLKEFANSGHLDAIAVFLTTAAVWAVVARGLRRNKSSGWQAVAAGALFGLAIGAKLYAVVLVPLVGVFLWRRTTLIRATVFATTTVTTASMLLAPMLLTKPAVSQPMPQGTPSSSAIAIDATPQDAGGLTTFLMHWEMNDFLFMLLVENLRPVLDDAQPTPWLGVVPNSWRLAWTEPLAALLDVDQRTAGFFAARCASLAAFAILAITFAYRVWQRPSTSTLVRSAFSTLAWFWLLAPTQNPWYWTWALPFVPFATNRAWLAVSAWASIYYLRFWLSATWPEHLELAEGLDGAAFYDFVVVVAASTTWFFSLATASVIGRRSALGPARQPILSTVPLVTEN